jgi:hypothetical protein
VLIPGRAHELRRYGAPYTKEECEEKDRAFLEELAESLAWIKENQPEEYESTREEYLAYARTCAAHDLSTAEGRLTAHGYAGAKPGTPDDIREFIEMYVEARKQGYLL